MSEGHFPRSGRVKSVSGPDPMCAAFYNFVPERQEQFEAAVDTDTESDAHPAGVKPNTPIRSYSQTNNKSDRCEAASLYPLCDESDTL